jgi:hypothetical protein
VKTLNDISFLLATGKIDLTAHALKRIVERNISKNEIMEAATGVIEIEDYPDDKYFPSCLLLGFTKAGRPLHLHVSRVEQESIRLITIYEPNENDWDDGFRKRRK